MGRELAMAGSPEKRDQSISLDPSFEGKSQRRPLLVYAEFEPLHTLRVALASQGIDTWRARSGGQALSFLGNFRPVHVIFADKNLPDGTWLDLVRAKRRTSAPVIVEKAPVRELLLSRGVAIGRATAESIMHTNAVSGPICSNMSFEQFLSSHPWIGEKLRKHPTPANDNDFLNDNKELRNFLNAHPFVQADLKQEPRAFMQREQEFERWEREQVVASRDAHDASVAEFDPFLSNHPWIAKKLKEKPSLANDKDFLNDNSELAHFLNAHPYVQSALREDPVGFMQRVRDFEIYRSYYNDEAMRGQLAEFDQFLANHPWIAKKLRENPSRANDQDFLHDNPQLRDYLSAHPVLQQEFRSNPQRVMNRAYARAY